MISGPSLRRRYISLSMSRWPFGVIECVPVPPGNIFKYDPPAKMTLTARTASKVCARSPSEYSEIFCLDPISWGIPEIVEPWPECRPERRLDNDGGSWWAPGAPGHKLASRRKISLCTPETSRADQASLYWTTGQNIHNNNNHTNNSTTTCHDTPSYYDITRDW